MSRERMEDELKHTSSDSVAMHTRQRNQLEDKTKEELRREHHFKTQE